MNATSAVKNISSMLVMAVNMKSVINVLRDSSIFTMTRDARCVNMRRIDRYFTRQQTAIIIAVI